MEPGVIMYAFIVLLCASSCLGCPFPVNQLQVKANLDVEKFAGTWYEILYKKPYFEEADSVLHNYVETYTLNAGDNSLAVSASGRRIGAENCTSFKSRLEFDPNEPGKMRKAIRFNQTEITMLDYWVIETDYEQFAYFYGCTRRYEDGYCEEGHGVVLGRESELSPDVRASAGAAMDALCETNADYRAISQDNPCVVNGATGYGGLPLVTLATVVCVYFTLIY